MKVFAHRCREIIPLVLSFAAFALAVFSVWFFFFKPWPAVETSDNWILVDEPAEGYYVGGEFVSWLKPRVCVPEGETTAQIFFVRTLPDGIGTVRQLAYTRIFLLDHDDCRTPNSTTIMVPYDLLPGSYDILVRTCTNTPSPLDACIEAAGPRILVRADREG